MTLYLDENLSEYVAQALDLLSKSHFPDVEVLSTKSAFGKGIKDTELIPLIASAGGILVTQDTHIHKRKAEFELCRQYGLSIFFSLSPKRKPDIGILLKRSSYIGKT